MICPNCKFVFVMPRNEPPLIRVPVCPRCYCQIQASLDNRGWHCMRPWKEEHRLTLYEENSSG